jgi:molybdenum cofactor guanylyltransferase
VETRTGAIVLAGGRSSRMGRPKAGLEWHGSTLLRRTVGVLARVVDGPVLVVAAPDQALPDLPATVQVVHDPVEGRGPLQGLATGLSALDADAAFVCSTDLPQLHPRFVAVVLRALTGTDVALPVVGGVRQPLAAAWSTALADVAASLLAEGRDRPAHLLERARVTALDDAALLADRRLAAADPGLSSVDGVDTPEAYERARALPAPCVTVQRTGPQGFAPRPLRAATLGAAASAVGATLDRHLLAAVNGDAVLRDPTAPLVEGDEVVLLSADAGG